MHNIYDVNRSVAGHYIAINHGHITISKNANSFMLPISDNSVDYYVDTAKAVIDKNFITYKVAGWAYQRRSTAPAKSIYIAYKGKLVSKSNSTRRIDVRIAKDLTYDHCGFECSFNLPHSSRVAEVLCLIIVAEDSVIIEHLKVINPIEIKKLTSTPVIIDKNVTLTTTSNFEYSIDSVETLDDELVLKGWCFLREDPNTEIYVSFLKSGVALGSLCLNTIRRADVGALNNLDGNHFYGFEFRSHRISELPINPSDMSLDALFVAPHKKIKELISLVGSSS